MATVTVKAASDTATLDYTPVGVEPTGPGLTSVSKLGTGTLNKRMDLLAAGNGITLPPAVFSDPDMNYPPAYPVYGYYLAKPTSVLGSGVDRSVLEVKAGTLTQTYQKLAGTAQDQGKRIELQNAAVSGDRIRFSLPGPDGDTTDYSGRVTAATMQGTFKSGAREGKWTARRM